MEMQKIEKSSNINAVGYDHDARELHVEFKNGSRYAYKGVAPDHVERLVTSDSPGAYFSANVRRGDFPFRKIED